MVANKFIGHLIQLEGRYTRLDMFCQFAKRTTNELVSLTHQLYFIFSLQKYLHTGLVRTHSASVNTARIKQTVVVTHEQMALNLLQRVENDTHENQQ